MPQFPIRTGKPYWLKAPLPSGSNFNLLEQELKSAGLATVCQEAKCPNLGECWGRRTATIMILGDTCTRACKFCKVKTGNPKGIINSEEIENSSKLVGLMKLRYVVITSVDRDDLADFGSSHFKNVVNQVHLDHPQTKVEVLVPDFSGVFEHCKTLASAGPFVIAQNIETVERLTHPVRDRRASYKRTMEVLDFYKKNNPNQLTKSSIMVGLGETQDEILQTMRDLRQQKVDILTIGQYLQPSANHLPVEKFYHPDEFASLKDLGLEMGFQFVASGPLVRSSYKASDFLDFIESKSHVTISV